MGNQEKESEGSSWIFCVFRMFDYSKTKKEKVVCNLCGSDQPVILARRSKNNLPVTTVFCRDCSLIFINPRMTAAGYNNYYKNFYRLDRNAIKGTENETDLERNFENAKKFGRALANRYGKYLNNGLVVDVGSSTGGILFGLREIISTLKIFGIEPSVAESVFARNHGVPTETALFENFRVDLPEAPTSILCVQSLNHLLNPKGFMIWAREKLIDGGALFLAVKNFRHQARRAGSIEAGVQIDHPYMFTPETLRAMVESVGFRIAVFEVDEGKSQSELLAQRAKGLPRHHIWLVAIKDNSKKLAQVLPNFWVRLKLRLAFSRPILKLFYLIKYVHR